MSCKCRVCVRDREWKRQGVPDEVLDHIAHLEMHEGYHNSLMEGKWPSGKKILQKALDKYKEEE